MDDAEQSADELADVLREASRGADPGLTAELVAAACDEQADAALEAVVISAQQTGTHREDLLEACNAARLVIRTQAGSDRNDDVPAEDHVLDVMDRLTGWCHPNARL
jgi:hypothetical protein